ncbi:MAG: hypothetical protein K8I30_02420, partial [Anaerolineae bacterium]|nr:hypothetical protein [Anaerolineae bacterium]
MSDDFDKLEPTGDEDDSDDESLDWLRDEKPKKPGEAASGGDLGFTGELSWKQDVEDAFNEQLSAANEDAFDWQQKQRDKGESGAASGGFGFTGELDWKKAQQSGGMPDAGGDDDSLDWIKGVEEEPAPADEDDPFANLTVPVQPEPEPEDDPLAWMNQYGSDLASDEPAQSAQSAPSFMDEDEDIFATPRDQLDAPDEQDDPLSWLNQFSAADEPPPEAASPSWLDEPEDVVPSDAVDADLPPWLSENVPTEKPITEGGKLSEDWLAGAEDAPSSAEAEMSFDDWQRMQNDLTRPRDIDEEMPDLFSEMNATPPVSEGDLSTTDTGQLPSWVLGMDELDAEKAPDWLADHEPEATPSAAVPDDIFAELDASEAAATYDFPDDPLAGLDLGVPGADETPDWLKENAPQAASPAPGIPEPDDIFAELGLETPETGYDFLDNPVTEDEPLAGLNLGGSTETPDWFAEAEQPAASGTPDWLQDLGDLSQASEATTLDMNADIVPAEDDFLAELRGTAKQPIAEIDPMDTSGLQDIDSLLASYDDATALPSTGELMGGGDLDRLLSDNDLEQISARRTSDARPGAGGVTGL